MKKLTGISINGVFYPVSTPEKSLKITTKNTWVVHFRDKIVIFKTKKEAINFIKKKIDWPFNEIKLAKVTGLTV
jgi:hypothetical protein